jgi:transcriptional regulator with GAF, ATPase, and Fis domain
LFLLLPPLPPPPPLGQEPPPPPPTSARSDAISRCWPEVSGRDMLTRDMLTMLLPAELERVFTSTLDPDAMLTALMPVLCETWQCERCFLCLRDPNTTLTRITHSHCTRADRESLLETDWVLEDEAIQADPLMVIAFRTPEAVYVEDVEIADASVINLAYEQQVFKSRALIHVPIYHQGQLYGILEPCVFDQPRVWTAFDQELTVQVQQRLVPWIMEYLAGEGKAGLLTRSLAHSLEAHSSSSA